MLYAAYNEQQNNNSSASYDEQLKALYDDYKSKEEAYDEAIKQRKSTIQSADRSLEDANTPESVDTASALTENDDLQEKQLAVDELAESHGGCRRQGDGSVGRTCDKGECNNRRGNDQRIQPFVFPTRVPVTSLQQPLINQMPNSWPKMMKPDTGSRQWDKC